MDTIESDAQEFHNLHPNKKLKILGLIALVFALSIGIGLYIAGRGGAAGPARNATTTPKEGASTLRIVPEAQTLSRGKSMKVNVLLEGTGSQATDIVITYDPKVVKLTDIVNGEVFPDILRSDIGPRSLTVSAAVDPNAPTTLHTGTLFSFTLQGVTVGTTTLAFDTTLTITATNGTNTLGTAAATTVTVE